MYYSGEENDGQHDCICERLKFPHCGSFFLFFFVLFLVYPDGGNNVKAGAYY